MGAPPAPAHLVIECVRGERPWADLSEVGIRIHTRVEGGVRTYTDENPSGILVPVSTEDVAEGLLRQLGDSESLRVWGLILLSASFLDFETMESHPAFDTLLDAVWDASFGSTVSAEAVSTARRVVLSPGSGGAGPP